MPAKRAWPRRSPVASVPARNSASRKSARQSTVSSSSATCVKVKRRWRCHLCRWRALATSCGWTATATADIDELDIARVRVGQTVDVRSDAFAGRSFPGKVIHVSQRMGRRNLSSGDPAEKQDSKILEALILLEGHPDLPVGLRVDVFIETTRAPD